MAEGYRIIGAEMSPYSVKIRSCSRYKAIPHQWILRNARKPRGIRTIRQNADHSTCHHAGGNLPILVRQVGKQFWPWTFANETALTVAKEEFSVTLSGGSRSRKNITRGRSMRFWPRRVALPDCALRYRLPAPLPIPL